MLGWDVGTFEIISRNVLALNYNTHAKLKLRTGGSVGFISKAQCQNLSEGDGMIWDIAKMDGKHVQLPVRFRYRSPVVFEFHVASKRGAVAYAIVWLHHLVDNEPTDIDVPIWTTKRGPRLTQNYIVEEMIKAKSVTGLEDLTEVGRLQFRCRFKAGTDESHEQFIVDDDTRETFETWEACFAEGVRNRRVSTELPQKVKELHENSLSEGRDILLQASPEEKRQWTTQNGQDWSEAFGYDPEANADFTRMKRGQSGKDQATNHPFHSSSDNDESDDGDDDDSELSSEDLGIQDATNTEFAKTVRDDASADSAKGQFKHSGKEANKRSEKRKHRGLMQWRPIRNAAFAKDEAKFAMKRIKKKITGGLDGRQPTVETETGS